MTNHDYPEIAFADIQPGDKIRGEALNDTARFDCGAHSPVAVEFISTDRERTDGWVDFAPDERKWYLIDRPVTVPTRLYSLVVPPESDRPTYQAYVLEPCREENAWFLGSYKASHEEVEKKLRQGWRAIEGPEW